MARHRKTSRSVPSRRGSALAATAAGAVLIGGYQAAVPALAQANPVADQAAQVQQRIMAEVRASGQMHPGRVQAAFDAAGGAQAAASAAELLSGSLGSAIPPLLGGQRAVVPVSGTVTSEFGPRWGTTHGGMDIAGSIGTPILAAAAGTVVEAGPEPGFGRWVRVSHDDGTTTVYGHIHEALVSQGQRVQAGQPIATVGNRGDSTGPHLHFETWDAAGNKMDPKQWLAQRGAGEGSGSLGSLF